jgi:hypothetical protein
MKIFTLILLLCAVVIANAQQIEKTFKRTGMAPVIDGIVDENDPWSEDDWMEIAFQKAANTTSDASSKMQMLFSKDLSATGGFIYLVISVSDETPNNDVSIPDTYNRDCNEIFFSMDTVATEGGGAYKAGSWQIRILREEPDGNLIGGNSHANTWSVGTLTESADFKMAVEANSSEYVTEVAFPVAVLAEGAAFDGKNFRFDIQTGDNSNGEATGRTQQIYWNNVANDEQWRDTRAFGLVTISDEVIHDVSAKNFGTAKGIATVKNNMLNVSNVNGKVSIYDLKGSVMRQANINGKGSIDISDLKAGMYVVKGNGIAQKIVK